MDISTDGRLCAVYRAATALIGTVATYLWGGWDTAIKALVVLVCLDYATGVIAAAVQGQLDSAIGARGIARKVMLFAVVAAATVVDRVGGFGEPVMRTITALWYAANEALSVLENAGEIGVPIPERLCRMLARLRDEGGNHDVGGS
jgi:toxin secretion/phage lysis holin